MHRKNPNHKFGLRFGKEKRAQRIRTSLAAARSVAVISDLLRHQSFFSRKRKRLGRKSAWTRLVHSASSFHTIVTSRASYYAPPDTRVPNLILVASEQAPLNTKVRCSLMDHFPACRDNAGGRSASAQSSFRQIRQSRHALQDAPKGSSRSCRLHQDGDERLSLPGTEPLRLERARPPPLEGGGFKNFLRYSMASPHGERKLSGERYPFTNPKRTHI